MDAVPDHVACPFKVESSSGLDISPPGSKYSSLLLTLLAVTGLSSSPSVMVSSPIPSLTTCTPSPSLLVVSVSDDSPSVSLPVSSLESSKSSEVAADSVVVEEEFLLIASAEVLAPLVMGNPFLGVDGVVGLRRTTPLDVFGGGSSDFLRST